MLISSFSMGETSPLASLARVTREPGESLQIGMEIPQWPGALTSTSQCDGNGLLLASVLLIAAGCSSVSICLEQEKGVSPPARTPGAKGARRLDRRGHANENSRCVMAKLVQVIANRTEKLRWRG
jgi:hypothetical protein